MKKPSSNLPEAIFVTSVTGWSPERLGDAAVEYVLKSKAEAEAAELRTALAVANEVIAAVNSIVPFVHEDKMEGETAYEKAVLKLEKALAAHRARVGGGETGGL